MRMQLTRRQLRGAPSGDAYIVTFCALRPRCRSLSLPKRERERCDTKCIIEKLHIQARRVSQQDKVTLCVMRDMAAARNKNNNAMHVSAASFMLYKLLFQTHTCSVH